MQIDLEEVQFLSADWTPAPRSDYLTELMNYYGITSTEADTLIQQLLDVRYIHVQHGLIHLT